MTLPGPPVSVNHQFKIVVVPKKGGGGLVRRLGKADGVEAYQAGITYIAKAARPSGWEPANKIRLRYWFYLSHEIDCDNALKAINDAIAVALGVNDKGFLPCVQDKIVAKGTDPHVVVEVENE